MAKLAARPVGRRRTLELAEDTAQALDDLCSTKGIAPAVVLRATIDLLVKGKPFDFAQAVTLAQERTQAYSDSLRKAR